VLQVGDTIPAAIVWHGPNTSEALTATVAEGACLFVFYLFDWSST
jgi:hypothetical protein